MEEGERSETEGQGNTKKEWRWGGRKERKEKRYSHN